MMEEMAMLCVMLGVAVTTAFVIWAVRSYRSGKLPGAAASGSVIIYTLIWAAIVFWQLPIANGHGIREADFQEMSGRILAAQQYAMEQILEDCEIKPEDIRIIMLCGFLMRVRMKRILMDTGFRWTRTENVVFWSRAEKSD